MSQGSVKDSVTTIATSLGTKATVCSCTCVSACNKPTIKPTSMPATSTGAPSNSDSMIASRVMSTASWEDMGNGDLVIGDCRLDEGGGMRDEDDRGRLCLSLIPYP